MIPYIEIPPIPLWGSYAVHPFGVLVVIGCFVGAWVARWHAASLGLELSGFLKLITWVLIPGFLVSHLVVLLFYYPEQLRFGWGLLDVGRGMSSFGGFFGGALGAVFYLRRNRLPILPYVDALLLGLVAGWFFGRLGCSLVHDHPGLHTDFVLGVAYPDGTRHDLGFYEWLFTIVLNLLLYKIRLRRYPPGVLTGVACVLYAPVRYSLDFLRDGEKLHYGYTPGQYFAVVLLMVGLLLLVHTVQARPVAARRAERRN